jgi:hypothetical protein
VPEVLASFHPTSWDVPLFLHVLGAMVLVGSLLAALTAFVLQWRPAAEFGATLRRFAFRSLLAAAVPAFFAMRIGAQWIYSKEFPGGGDDPTWVGIGFMVSDLGGLLLIAGCILAWRATKREATGGLARAATILTGIILALDLVAMWAMTTKPS